MSKERELAVEGLHLWAKTLTIAWEESAGLEDDRRVKRTRNIVVRHSRHGGGGHGVRNRSGGSKRGAKKK